MTWDEALLYEADVRGIARRWAYKIDPDLYEDVVQHTFIAMVEKIDLTKADGPEREYVRGAIWNIVRRFFTLPNIGMWDYVSLEQLRQDGVQIDEDFSPRWVGPDGEYKGDYRPDGS